MPPTEKNSKARVQHEQTPDKKGEINPGPPINFFEKVHEHQTMLYEKINNLEKHIKETETVTQKKMQKMNDRIGKMELNYMDIFEYIQKRLTDLDTSVKNYGKTGTNYTRWKSEFKEGMADEINKKLEELIAAKDVKPGVWRKMANVLHRENKNKNLENMQKNMENMQEEVKKLREDIKWLEQTKMQENVNELAEKIKEWNKEDVSQPDDQKNDTDDKGSELEEALESYVKGGPAEGSEEDKKLKFPMPPAANEYYKRHGLDPEKINYKTEIKNWYIV